MALTLGSLIEKGVQEGGSPHVEHSPSPRYRGVVVRDGRAKPRRPVGRGHGLRVPSRLVRLASASSPPRPSAPLARYSRCVFTWKCLERHPHEGFSHRFVLSGTYSPGMKWIEFRTYRVLPRNTSHNCIFTLVGGSCQYVQYVPDRCEIECHRVTF